jgi:hypothetical protein
MERVSLGSERRDLRPPRRREFLPRGRSAGKRCMRRNHSSSQLDLLPRGRMDVERWSGLRKCSDVRRHIRFRKALGEQLLDL